MCILLLRFTKNCFRTAVTTRCGQAVCPILQPKKPKIFLPSIPKASWQWVWTALSLTNATAATIRAAGPSPTTPLSRADLTASSITACSARFICKRSSNRLTTPPRFPRRNSSLFFGCYFLLFSMCCFALFSNSIANSFGFLLFFNSSGVVSLF